MSNTKFWNLDKIRVTIIFGIIFLVNIIILSFAYMKKSNDCYKKDAYIKELEANLASIQTDYDNEIISLKTDYELTIENQKKDIETLKTNYDELFTLAQETNDYNKELLADNDMLDETNVELVEKCELMQDMLNKYEEYEVFMFKYEGSTARTDCSYELLEYLDSLIKDKAVNNLPFYCSWIMIESNWNNHDYNTRSTAYGLPQFLSSTGKWVYTEMLGAPNGPYDHEMVTDPTISLPMMIAYVDSLYNGYGGDLQKAIDSYRGFHDEPYLKRFNYYLSFFDLSIDKVAEMSKQNYDEMNKPQG